MKNVPKITFKLANLRNKSGSQPIRCIIRLNGEYISVHTSLFVSNKKFWIAKNKTYKVANDPRTTSELGRIKSELLTTMSVFIHKRQTPTPKELYKAWNNSYEESPNAKPKVEKEASKKIKDILEEWLENFKLKVSTQKRKESTLVQWADYTKKLAIYFGERRVDSVKYSEYDKIITYFEHDLKLHINSSAHLFKFLKRILEYAVMCDYIHRNPFKSIFAETIPQQKFYLQAEELQSLEANESPLEEHNISKDVFLFCAYSGLSYSDYACLKNENLITHKGKLFIFIEFRQKSPLVRKYGKSFIPVHKKLAQIIEKYGDLDNLPLKNNNNSVINKHLKFFWGLCKISPKIALKHARHTFSNYARKVWGLHKDTIQTIMGHSDKSSKILDQHYLDEDLDSLLADLENAKGFWQSESSSKNLSYPKKHLFLSKIRGLRNPQKNKDVYDTPAHAK